MTRKKPGAVRGRPSAGLDVHTAVRLTPEVVAELDAAAAEAGTDRSAIIRDVLERWAKRRAKSQPRA